MGELVDVPGQLTIPGLPGYLHCAVAAAVVGVLCVAVVAATPGGGRG